MLTCGLVRQHCKKIVTKLGNYRSRDRVKVISSYKINGNDMRHKFLSLLTSSINNPQAHRGHTFIFIRTYFNDINVVDFIDYRTEFHCVFPHLFYMPRNMRPYSPIWTFYQFVNDTKNAFFSHWLYTGNQWVIKCVLCRKWIYDVHFHHISFTMRASEVDSHTHTHKGQW